MPAAGWDGLPPVPRALDEAIPLVVHDDATRDALASHARPEQLLAPLAHTISPEGPVGIVWGLVGLYPPFDGSEEEAGPGPDPVSSEAWTSMDFAPPRRTLASFAQPPAPRRAMTAAPSPDVVVRRAAVVEGAAPETLRKAGSDTPRREEPVAVQEPAGRPVVAPEPSLPEPTGQPTAAPEATAPAPRPSRFKGVLGPPLTSDPGDSIARGKPGAPDPRKPADGAPPSSPAPRTRAPMAPGTPKPAPPVAPPESETPNETLPPGKRAMPADRPTQGLHPAVDAPVLGEEPVPAALPVEPGLESTDDDAPPRRAPSGPESLHRPERGPRSAPLPGDAPVPPTPTETTRPDARRTNASLRDSHAPGTSRHETETTRKIPARVVDDTFIPIPPADTTPVDESAPNPSIPGSVTHRHDPETPQERSAPEVRDTFVPLPAADAPTQETTAKRPHESAEAPRHPVTAPHGREGSRPLLGDEIGTGAPDASDVDKAAPDPTPRASAHVPAPPAREPVAPPETSAPLLGDMSVTRTHVDAPGVAPDAAHEHEVATPRVGETSVPIPPVAAPSHEDAKRPDESAEAPKHPAVAARERGGSPPLLGDTIEPGGPDAPRTSLRAPAPPARQPAREPVAPPDASAPLPGDTFVTRTHVDAPELEPDAAHEREASVPPAGDTFIHRALEAPRADVSPEREVSAPLLGDTIRRVTPGPETDAPQEREAPTPAPGDIDRPSASPPQGRDVWTPLVGGTVAPGATTEAPARVAETPTAGATSSLLRPTVRDVDTSIDAPRPDREISASTVTAPLLGDSGAPTATGSETPRAPGAPVEAPTSTAEAAPDPLLPPRSETRTPHETEIPRRSGRPVDTPVHERNASPTVGDARAPVPGKPPLPEGPAPRRQLPAVPPPPPMRDPDPEPAVVPDRLRRDVEGATSVDLRHVTPRPDHEISASTVTAPLLGDSGTPIGTGSETPRSPATPVEAPASTAEAAPEPLPPSGRETHTPHEVGVFRRSGGPVDTPVHERNAPPVVGDARAPLLGTPPLPEGPSHRRQLPAVPPPPPPPRGPDPEPAVVPDRLRRDVEGATSVTLGHVDVVRGPGSARAAATLGAKAFVHAGVVHLPRALGSLETEPARGILAHELVHVAQQRSHPDPLPSEDSREGRALEHQAERIATDTRETPKPQAGRFALPDLPPEIAHVDHSGALVFSQPPPPPPIAASPAPAAPQSAPIQRKPVDDAPAKAEKPEPPQLDLDDLARRLYPRIRPYLRKELSLDRERAALTLGTSR